MIAPQKPVARNESTKTHRQLIVRAAVAAALIVALLAGLLIFESKPDPASEPAPIARVITPQSASRTLADDAQDALKKSSEAATTETASLTTGSAPAADASAPASAPTAEASPPAPRGVPEGSEDPTAGSVLGVPPPPAAKANLSPTPATPAPRQGGRLVLEASSASPTPKANSGTVSRPIAPATAPANGFIVQVGVFSSHSNAEEVHAKLKAQGIPSQIESRVSLGPFKNREEALAAQQKLAKLGLGKGLLVGSKK